MSELTVYATEAATPLAHLTDHAAIAAELAPLGVRFARWRTDRPLAIDAGQEEVLAAYADDVERLNGEFGFQSVDVVALRPDHPEREALRAKFLQEHVHDDFEVRFFVDGRGLFYIHAGERVYGILCEQGDLISVPAGAKHWFDTGAAPDFKCIRLFTTPNGWEASFTGDAIDARFPRLEG